MPGDDRDHDAGPGADSQATDAGGNDDSGPLPPAIRAGTPGDLPALLRVQGASLPDPRPEFLRTGLRAGLVLVADALAPPAVDDGAADPDPGTGPTGSGAVGTTPGDPVGYLLHTVDDRDVYAAELAVAPGHRRRGHATRLLDAVAARYPDRERLRLTTRRSNRAAQAFYRAVGFRERRTLPDHYHGDGTGGGEGGADGVLLVRDL